MQANFITCSKGAKVQSVRITELTGQISAKTDKHTEFSSTGTDAWSPLPLMTAPNVKPVLQFLHLQLCPLGSKWHKFLLITRTSLSRHYTTLYTAQAQYSVSRHMPRRLEKSGIRTTAHPWCLQLSVCVQQLKSCSYKLLSRAICWVSTSIFTTMLSAAAQLLRDFKACTSVKLFEEKNACSPFLEQWLLEFWRIKTLIVNA